jgi:hypothetical protein
MIGCSWALIAAFERADGTGRVSGGILFLRKARQAALAHHSFFIP